MSLSPTERSLLVIDDTAIRRRAFERAANLLSRIDRLEETIRAFRNEDQKLYEEWQDLTFRPQRERIERAREEHFEFMRFHNAMITLTRLFDWDMPEAFRFLRDEQERWENGSAQTRAEIENARRKREEFMEQEIAREEAEEAERQRQQVRREEVRRPREKKARDLGERLRRMTDEEITALFSTTDDTTDVLIFVYTNFALAGDPETFHRFWGFAPARTRAKFRELLKRNGLIDDLVPDDEPRESDEERVAQATEDAAADAGETPEPEDDRIKRLYRLLVRRLHPDAHASSKTSKAWHIRAWEELQSFVKFRDLRGLERLQAITVLRTESLNELSLDEIIASHQWVSEELHRRQREASSLRNKPAWNFSKRKNFDTLTRKITRELARELAVIEEELEVYRYQHQTLEAMSDKRVRKQERKTAERPRRRAERW